MLKKYYPYLIILFITAVFFWKLIFQNAVAMPGDLMVGAYYPWLEYKYGYAVGVPVKNGLISDVFSQFYIWKKLIAESYSRGDLPLWNPYSYSGYPLLANFHSGSLYILNILFIPFEFSTGWNLFVISGILGSSISMFLLLKELKYKNWSSIIGAVAYSFSGYSIVWMQFATAGHSMIWVPLLILFIEKYFNTKKIPWLFCLSPVLFLLVTAGHFQIMVYGFFISAIFFLFKFINSKNKDIVSLLTILISYILGIGISAIQILPTLELSSYSVRFQEQYIEGINFGLLPIKNIVTLFAPDFFGNPATGNYWGFWNYHETMIYLGIPSLFALVWSISNFLKLNKNEKFFLITAIVSLLFALDTPIGKLIYQLNIPGLSTSAAGRIIAIFSLASSILLASFIEKVRIDKLRQTLGNISPLIELVFIVGLITILLKYTYFLDSVVFLIKEKQNINIIFRNLAIPTLLSGLFFFVIIFHKTKLYYFAILSILVIDLFRFGWKYTPFVSKDMVFPNTEVTDFIKKQNGIFRIEKEFAELLPPNTWSYYHLMSPSGYDPVAPNQYTRKFYANFIGDPTSSRYAEIRKYDSKMLGNYNVKYLLALKRDEKAVIPGDNISYKIDPEKWKRTFETDAVAVLENTDYKERAFLEGNTGSVKINLYTPQKIEIAYTADTPSNLILLDAWYPGWKAKVNGSEVEIDRYDDVFRTVKVPQGSGNVVFEYNPQSVRYGVYISFMSLILGSIAVIFFIKNTGSK